MDLNPESEFVGFCRVAGTGWVGLLPELQGYEEGVWEWEFSVCGYGF